VLLFTLDVIISPEADAKSMIAKLESERDGACLSLEKSLAQFGKNSLVDKQNFMKWAELMVPQLSSTLSTFVHNLLFHTKWTHHHLNFVPFEYPKLDHMSSIFVGPHCSNLFALALTSPLMGGKWHNLYSFEYHGNSMNRLQVSLMSTQREFTFMLTFQWYLDLKSPLYSIFAPVFHSWIQRPLRHGD
jgi:hypothetical protein